MATKTMTARKKKGSRELNESFSVHAVLCKVRDLAGGEDCVSLKDAFQHNSEGMLAILDGRLESAIRAAAKTANAKVDVESDLCPPQLEVKLSMESGDAFASFCTCKLKAQKGLSEGFVVVKQGPDPIDDTEIGTELFASSEIAEHAKRKWMEADFQSEKLSEEELSDGTVCAGLATYQYWIERLTVRDKPLIEKEIEHLAHLVV